MIQNLGVMAAIHCDLLWWILQVIIQGDFRHALWSIRERLDRFVLPFLPSVSFGHVSAESKSKTNTNSFDWEFKKSKVCGPMTYVRQVLPLC